MKRFEFDASGNRRYSRICVEGYHDNRSISGYELRMALRKHFSSCGEILHVYLQRDFQRDILKRMVVTGYDTSLPKIDVQIGLGKYFSSCGMVSDVRVHAVNGVGLHKRAYISIMGEGAIDKALELSGRDVGGWNITVVEVMPPPGTADQPSICRSLPKEDDCEEEAYEKWIPVDCEGESSLSSD